VTDRRGLVLREVIVWPRVHNVLWQNLPKEAYERVRDRLIKQLETRLEHWRARRHPEDETLFVYTLSVALGEDWHTFEFYVDDTMADTSVFVLDVVHTLGRTGMT
jgi:hypothetical protein